MIQLKKKKGFPQFNSNSKPNPNEDKKQMTPFIKFINKV